jgi:hypothetical protein
MELTEGQIKFLDEVCMGSWSLNENGEVDVDSPVDMNRRNLTEIPIKFGRVCGAFLCANNQLTTLKNCPNLLDGGYLHCYNNPPLKDYWKSIKDDEFPLWYNLLWDTILDDDEYPFLINIAKKYISRESLGYYLEYSPLTKLYYRD